MFCTLSSLIFSSLIVLLVLLVLSLFSLHFLSYSEVTQLINTNTFCHTDFMLCFCFKNNDDDKTCETPTVLCEALLTVKRTDQASFQRRFHLLCSHTQKYLGAKFAFSLCQRTSES